MMNGFTADLTVSARRVRPPEARESAILGPIPVVAGEAPQPSIVQVFEDPGPAVPGQDAHAPGLGARPFPSQLEPAEVVDLGDAGPALDSMTRATVVTEERESRPGLFDGPDNP